MVRRPGSNGDVVIADFYKGKTVLVTGHTGFKGTWMCKVLNKLGSKVIGYSLDPSTDPNLYDISGVGSNIVSIIGDIRDLDNLLNVFETYLPEVVIHMAAQPLVGAGYSNPLTTYEINVMGTVNVLEAIRRTDCVKSFVNVTTDKVYLNNEWEWGYRETDVLNGFDPYSNSKSCSELVTSCYRNSFLRKKTSISSARAGNVIGGGDFTNPRIIPDCVRAAYNNSPLILRNPYSTRPYQHVLEPICAYLIIAEKQYFDSQLADSYNVGPNDECCVNNEALIKLFKECWGEGFNYLVRSNMDEPHEANFLKLDCSKICVKLGWKSIWSISQAVEKTVEWSKAFLKGNQNEIMDKQISEYLKEMGV